MISLVFVQANYPVFLRINTVILMGILYSVSIPRHFSLLLKPYSFQRNLPGFPRQLSPLLDQRH